MCGLFFRDMIFTMGSRMMWSTDIVLEEPRFHLNGPRKTRRNRSRAPMSQALERDRNFPTCPDCALLFASKVTLGFFSLRSSSLDSSGACLLMLAIIVSKMDLIVSLGKRVAVDFISALRLLNLSLLRFCSSEQLRLFDWGSAHAILVSGSFRLRLAFHPHFRNTVCGYQIHFCSEFCFELFSIFL